MSEISDQTPAGLAQDAELDDFDVEGHGLKEVAIGISAATAFAGGVSMAAMAVDNPLPNTSKAVGQVVAGAHSDVDDRLAMAQGAVAGTLDTAGTAVTGAQRMVDHVSGVTTSTVQPVAQRVDATGAQATQLAGEVAADPIGTSDRLVDEAVDTSRHAVEAARELRSEALSTAGSTVTGAQQTAADTIVGAQQTAADGVRLADDTAGDATALAGSTASSTIQTLDPKAEVETGEDGTTVTIGAAGKTVSANANTG